MESDYFKVLALSKSLIPSILRSPAHFLYEFETERKTSREMRRGSLIHVLTYHPDRFNDLYSVYDGPTKGTGSRKGKDEFKERCQTQGREGIDQEDLDSAIKVVDFLKSNRIIQRLMRDGVYELPFITKDPKHGVPIKGMFDCITDDFITDLKTTSGDPEIWMRRNMNSKTYIQIAWYLRLAELMDGKKRNFAFKVIDINPPYEIFIVEPEADLLKRANQECDEALEIFARCYKAESWPHNKTRIISWGVPKYLRSEIDE